MSQTGMHLRSRGPVQPPRAPSLPSSRSSSSTDAEVNSTKAVVASSLTRQSSSSEDHHSSQEEYAYFPPQGQSSFYPPPQISPVDPPSGFGPQDIFDYQGEHHDRVQQDLDDVYAMLAPHIQGRTDTPAGVSLKIESPADGPSETGSPIRPHISTGGSRKRKRGTIATKEKSSKKRDSLSEDATKGQAENDDVAQSSSTEASIEGARNSQTLMSDRPPVKPLPKRRRRM